MIGDSFKKVGPGLKQISQGGLLGLILGAVIATLAPPGAAAQQEEVVRLPLRQEKWLRAQTANFTIYSNAPEKIALLVGANLERLRKTLALLTNVAAVNTPVPTSIFLFKNHKSFTPYIFRVSGEVAPVGGYFLPRSDGNYMALSAEVGAVPTIQHEYIHFFFNNNHPGLPLWLNEGLAEYYSTFESDDNQAKVGLPVKHHLAFLQSETLMPLAQLFTIADGAVLYNEESKQGLFYAQSWLLVHYFLHVQQGSLRPAFAQFWTLLAQGSAPDSALHEAFGKDELQLQSELERYLRRFLFNYTAVSSQQLAVATAARVDILAYEEVLYRLGDLLVQLEDERGREAEAHFRQALVVNPNYAPAYAGLGVVATQQGKFPEARQFFQQAIQLDPSQTLIHYRLGQCLIAGVKYRARMNARDLNTPAVREAREAFRTAVDLDHNFLEAYAAFGETFVFDSKSPPEEGIAALEIALQRLPARMDIALNLLALYARNDDSTKAQVVFEKVITPRGRRAQIVEARERLVAIEMEKAVAWLEQGKIDEAMQALKRVQAGTQNPALLRQAQEMLQAAEHQRHLKLYNGALIRAANKDFDEALLRLQEAAATCEEAELQQAARSASLQVQQQQQMDWYNQAMAFMKTKQYRKAAPLLRRVVEAPFAPADPELILAAKEALLYIQRVAKQ